MQCLKVKYYRKDTYSLKKICLNIAEAILQKQKDENIELDQNDYIANLELVTNKEGPNERILNEKVVG